MEINIINKGRCLRVALVADRLGIGISTVWKLVKRDRNFPRPFKLSPRTTVWLEDELNSYINERAQGQAGGGRNE